MIWCLSGFLIITMIQWTRTSRLSIKNSLSLPGFESVLVSVATGDHIAAEVLLNPKPKPQFIDHLFCLVYGMSIRNYFTYGTMS